MPYLQGYHEPEPVLKYEGYEFVKAYKDDDYDQPLDYWFQVFDYVKAEHREFDIRDCQGYEAAADDVSNLKAAVAAGWFVTTMGIKPPKKLFFVDVGRTATRTLTLEVEALTAEAAGDLALERARDEDFNKGREMEDGTGYEGREMEDGPGYKVLDIRGDT